MIKSTIQQGKKHHLKAPSGPALRGRQVKTAALTLGKGPNKPTGFYVIKCPQKGKDGTTKRDKMSSTEIKGVVSSSGAN